MDQGRSDTTDNFFFNLAMKGLNVTYWWRWYIVFMWQNTNVAQDLSTKPIIKYKNELQAKPIFGISLEPWAYNYVKTDKENKTLISIRIFYTTPNTSEAMCNHLFECHTLLWQCSHESI